MFEILSDIRGLLHFNSLPVTPQLFHVSMFLVHLSSTGEVYRLHDVHVVFHVGYTMYQGSNTIFWLEIFLQRTFFLKFPFGETLVCIQCILRLYYT